MAGKVVGGKVESIKSLKKSLKKGGGGGKYFTRVKADEELQVRFITEPDEWVTFYEHYDSVRKFYPCTSQDCPGCADKSTSRSARYLANAVDINEGNVVALAMPKSLASALIKFYEKYDTITDRDYELSREGEGFDTEYSAIPEAPTKFNISKFEPLDLMTMLEAQVNDDDEEDDEDEDEDEAPARPVRRTPKKIGALKRR